MFPNDAVPNTALGLPNSGELNRLNTSARNWNLSFSPIRKFLNTEKSESNRCGPCSRLRPALPYVYCAGIAKAAPAMHPVKCPSPQFADGAPTRFGRYVPPALVLAVSVEIETLKGSPLCSVVMPLICQSANAVRRIPREERNSGNS